LQALRKLYPQQLVIIEGHMLSKVAMAQRMATSRSQLERV
jgi:hypothetical protein